MEDHRIGSKSFNPYDLGSVARATKEFRTGQHRMGQTRPYTPPRSKQGESSVDRKDTKADDK